MTVKRLLHALVQYERRQWQKTDRFLNRHAYVTFLGIMIAVAVGCLFIPPYHVLSQDFVYAVQVIATVIAIVLGFLSSRKVNVFHHAPLQNLRKTGDALRLDVAYLCLIAAIPYLTVMLSSYFVKQCRIFEGSVAFWVSVPPSFLAGLVWGYCGGLFTRKWRFFWLLTIVGAVLVGAYEGANARYGYHGNFPFLIFGNDPFQRNDALPHQFHLYSRVFLLVTTVLLYSWATLVYLLKYLRRNVTWRRVSATIGATIVLFGVGWLTQGETGLGWSYRRIDHYLTQQRQIANVRIHYHPENRIEPHVWRNVEWTIQNLAQQMGVTPDPENIIEVYVFPSYDDVKNYANGNAHAYAKSGKFYMNQWSLDSTTFAHELAHVFHGYYERSWKLNIRRAFDEGTAVAFTEGLTLSPEHHEAMAIVELEGNLPSIRKFYNDLLFIKTPESLAYDACGSFVGFLVLEYGIEKYTHLNATMDFAAVYGLPLDELNDQWKAFLQAIPVDYARKRDLGRWYASQEAYTAQCCPQVGKRPEVEIPGSQDLAWWFDPVGASALYAESRERQPKNPEWIIKHLTAMTANQEWAGVEAGFETVLTRAIQDNDAGLQYDIHRLQFFYHALNRNLDGAIAALQHMLAISEDTQHWPALRLQMLQHPDLGPAYLQAVALDWQSRECRLITLYHAAPEFGPAYAYAFYFTDITADLAGKRRFLTEFLTRTEGFAPLKARAYIAFLRQCLQYQHYDVAKEALASFPDLFLINKDKADILEITNQLQFEREHFAGAPRFLTYQPWHLTETRSVNNPW